MVVERKLRFEPTTAYDRFGRRVRLPGGIASVTSSPLMESEAVLFEAPSDLILSLAQGEVGRLIQAGRARAVSVH